MVVGRIGYPAVTKRLAAMSCGIVCCASGRDCTCSSLAGALKTGLVKTHVLAIGPFFWEVFFAPSGNLLHDQSCYQALAAAKECGSRFGALVSASCEGMCPLI